MKNTLIKSVSKNRTVADLQRLQALPLEQKVNLTLRRITDFLNIMDNKCYISFSGGKDSTVLLDLVRQINPDIGAVFVDTGLEFDSIRKFVKTFDNVKIVKPKMRFDEVIKKYGYPVVSKKVSMGVSRYRNTKSEIQKELRMKGGINPTSKRNQKATIPIKNHFLVNAPFKISEKCCDIMKKNPAKKYSKLTGNKPFIGTMTEESLLRQQLWIQQGCNMFDRKEPQSTPLAFWTEKDIWDYIKSRELKYADIYDKGAKRTGCTFCMFGYWSKGDHKTDNDRMELLKRVEPKKYEYCMKDVEIGGLGLKKVIDYIDLKLRNGQKEWDL